jgi:ankyrin repeat protein
LRGIIFIKLRLRHCSALTVSELEKLVLLPKTLGPSPLRTLDISGCVQLSDDALVMLARHCPQLEKLNISRLPKLQSLYLSEGNFLNSSNRPLKFPHLKRLIITDCSQLRALSLFVPKLQFLVLSRCDRLKKIHVQGQGFEPEFLWEIPNWLAPSAKGQNCILNVSQWVTLTDDRLRSIVMSCHDVKKVNLSGCDAVTFREYKERVMTLVYKNEEELSTMDCHKAIRLGYWAIVELLVEQNPLAINAKNAAGKTVLIEVVEQGKIDQLKQLLGFNVPTNGRDRRGYSALMCAAEKGKTDIVQCLVEHGVNIHEANKEQIMAFSLAINNEYVILADFLKAQGAKLHPQDKLATRGLQQAVREGKLATVKLWLSYGANANIQDDKENPLFIGAVNNNHLDIAQCLLDAGADVNAKDANRNTALMHAAEKGDLKKVQWLVEHNANIHETNQAGQTALGLSIHTPNVKASYHEVSGYLLKCGTSLPTQEELVSKGLLQAILVGDLTSVTLWLNRGVKVDVQIDFTPFKMTAFMYAMHNNQYAIAQCLLDAGADVNAKDANRNTALMHAAEKGDLKKVQWLVEHNANIHETNETGETALVLSINTYNVNIYSNEISGYLTKRGAKLPEQSILTKMNLRRAVREGNLATVKLWLSYGANANIQDDKENPLFIGAVNNNHLDIAQCLLEAGADVDAKDNSGNTALMYAADKGNIQKVQWLVEHNANIHATNATGQTILGISILAPTLDRRAMDGKYNDISCYLLSRGAKLNAQEKSTNNGLAHAVEARDLATVRFLLNIGVDVETELDDGDKKASRRMSAFIWSFENNYFEVAQCLLDASADINAKDTDGKTALMRAADTGDINQVQWLLAHHASASVRDVYNMTDMSALRYAMNSHEWKRIMILLSEHGVSIKNDRDEKGKTLLMRAARRGDIDQVQWLLTQQVSVNARDKEGWSALRYALCTREWESIMNLLWEHGASIHDVIDVNEMKLLMRTSIEQEKWIRAHLTLQRQIKTVQHVIPKIKTTATISAEVIQDSKNILERAASSAGIQKGKRDTTENSVFQGSLSSEKPQDNNFTAFKEITDKLLQTLATDNLTRPQAVQARLASSKQALRKAKDYKRHTLFSTSKSETSNALHLSLKKKKQTQFSSTHNNANTLGLAQASHFNTLPDTMQLHIFSYLDYERRTTASSVCQWWRMLASHNDLNTHVAPLLTNQDIAAALCYMNDNRPECFELLEKNLTFEWCATRIKPMLHEARLLMVTFYNKTTSEEKHIALPARVLQNFAQEYTAQCQTQQVTLLI